MIDLVLALGAGMATAGSPCILPVLPFLLAASVGPRHRPLFIVLGFVLSFSVVAWLFGASAQVLGVSQQSLRTGGMLVMLLSGLMLLWPPLLARAMAPLGGLADLAQRLGQRAGMGLGGGLLAGMSLGLLWTPCAGPVLATVLALIATERHPQQAGGLLLAYALGAGLPMLALAYGGQVVAARARRLSRHAGRWRQVFGALVVATTAAMFAGVDVQAAAWLSGGGGWWPADAAPASAARAASAQEATAEMAPPLKGLTPWFNSPPLDLAQLRGHVVLIEFWTHACVNCLHTVPHLQRWHRQFKDQGLVVIGVHTPEFGFEREPARVQAAIRRLGIGYPVALDNDYATWEAWHNAYWPALYLVDAQGRIAYRHVGEGDAEQIEARIKAMLQRTN